MPNTLTEIKKQELRRLSSNFQTMIEHYLNSGRTEREHKQQVVELEKILHEISKKYRLAFKGCPPGFAKCGDGGCVRIGETCPSTPPLPPTI